VNSVFDIVKVDSVSAGENSAGKIILRTTSNVCSGDVCKIGIVTYFRREHRHVVLCSYAPQSSLTPLIIFTDFFWYEYLAIRGHPPRSFFRYLSS
jgi:hypothetical protein